MQVKDTAYSTFFQLFSPVSRFLKLHPLRDAYVKKMSSLQLIELLVCAHLEQQPSLRDISARLSNSEFSQVLGLDSISHSQIARRLRALCAKDLDALFRGIVEQIAKKLTPTQISQQLGRLFLVDSSTVSLCLSRYPWAYFRKTKSGIKLHLKLRFCDQVSIPEQALISEAKVADKTQMDHFVTEDPQAIYVFDRGYVDYQKFDAYCDQGIRFVTRLKGNAFTEVLESFLTTDPEVLKDQLVLLGSTSKTMKHPLRLVETQDTQGQPIIIVTNIVDIGAKEISSIYRNRWQVELFFKWMKQHLNIKHFYGQSPAAVENQVFLALITYCLTLLLSLKVGTPGTLLTLIRLLKNCICQTFSEVIKRLKREGLKLTRGRRKNKEEQIYRFTLQQVLAGDIELLNDLIYDPVIL